MRRSCNVFFREDEVLVASAAMTTHGFEIDADPVIKLCEDRSQIKIGEAVLLALKSYSVNVSPRGPNSDPKSSPVLRAGKYRTWGQLERRNRNVFVVEEAGSLRAIPTRRSAEGGYAHQNDLSIRAGLTAEEIGDAIQRALQSSQ